MEIPIGSGATAEPAAPAMAWSERPVVVPLQGAVDTPVSSAEPIAPVSEAPVSEALVSEAPVSEVEPKPTGVAPQAPPPPAEPPVEVAAAKPEPEPEPAPPAPPPYEVLTIETPPEQRRRGWWKR